MPGRRQRGYTLVEVIVAFALLAGALTLLLGTMSGATRQVRRAGDAGRAALHAQSLLAPLGVAVPLQPGRHSGEFEQGHFQWTLSVAPWSDPSLPPTVTADTGYRLFEVALDVKWGEGGVGETLRVRSLRLAPSEPGRSGGAP